jgi:hypothetical protein
VPQGSGFPRLSANTPKRALRITSRGVFVGQGGRLHLKYSFKSTAAQPADTPMYEDFRYTVESGMRTGFGDAFRRAMQTAR